MLRVTAAPAPASAGGPPDDVLFRAQLAPTLSTSLRATRWILSTFAALYLVAGLVFMWVGAGPVLAFVGIELVLLVAVYRFCVHTTRLAEDLTLTEKGLFVRRIDRRGDISIARLKRDWLQIAMTREPGRIARLILSNGPRRVEIGSFLPPPERQKLADELTAAIKRVTV